MISASKALSSIEQAILGTRRDEDRLTKMLASATDDAARLRSEQAEGFKSLARLKLDALAGDEIVGRLDSAERAAVAALAKRKAGLAELSDLHARQMSALADAEKAREAAAERLERAIDAIEALTDTTSERIADDADWQELSRKVEGAGAKAAAALEKASQAEADREAKRTPYDADPLFTYLWKRGYGTSDYRANPLVRYFDAKVARLVGYTVARPNFYMLNEIPSRLREHASRLEQVAAEARAGLEAYERRTLEADGISELEAEVEAATKARDDVDRQIEELQSEIAGIDERQAAFLDGSQDPLLSAALDGLTQAIAREELSDLYQEALATKTPEDEKIVRRLRDVEARLARREAEAEEVRSAAVELARKRAELEHSRDDFHRSGYDQPQGRFADGGIIGGVIQEILKGAMSSNALNDVLRDGFSVPKSSRRRGSFGGGVRMPRPSRKSSGSRSRSSGGFKTGGGF